MTYLSRSEQAELVSRTKDGDERAFGVLYEHFVVATTGHVLGRLRNPDDANDVAGDCFALALRAVKDGRFDPQYSFYTFLRGIADNEIKRFLKREYVQVPRLSDQGGSSYVPKVLAIPDRGPLPKDAWRKTDRILASLPPDDIDAVASELLRLVLSCPAKPHQNLAFCLIRFLEWRPREVVTEMSAGSLFLIARRVYKGFASLFPVAELAQTCPEEHCPEFWRQLEEPVRDVYPEPEYERLRKVPEARTRDLVLKELYGPNPTASLSDWCDKVRKRARKAVDGDMSHGS